MGVVEQHRTRHHDESAVHERICRDRLRAVEDCRGKTEVPAGADQVDHLAGVRLLAHTEHDAAVDQYVNAGTALPHFVDARTAPDIAYPRVLADLGERSRRERLEQDAAAKRRFGIAGWFHHGSSRCMGVNAARRIAKMINRPAATLWLPARRRQRFRRRRQ